MKYFEKIIEFFFMVRVALSPVIIGLMIGSYCFLAATTLYEQLVAIAIPIVSIGLGIFFVIRVRKKQSATEFMAKVNATPDLDKISEP